MKNAGSMYILLPVFLVLILLMISLLVFALRLIVISHNIDHAFERCGADLLTTIRKENYDAITESNSEVIDLRINNTSDSTLKNRLLFQFISNVSDYLGCRLDYRDHSIERLENSEIGEQNKLIYRISRFSFTYTENTGSIKAVAEIPVVLFGSNIQTYSKELCYEFVLSSKLG